MPTNFVIGQILMLVARRELSHGPKKVFTVPFTLSLLYSAFIFVPVTAWYFYNYTAWSTVYLVPEHMIPAWAGPFIFFLYFLGMVIGALLAQSLIQMDFRKTVFVMLILGIAWLIGTWLLTQDQYLHIGSYSEYHSSVAPSIFENKEFLTQLNIMGVILFLPAIGLALLFSQRSQRYRWRDD